MSKTSKGNNLNTYVAGTATQWKKQVDNYQNDRKQIRRAQKFALELLDYTDEHKIKQTELAKKMKVSPQQVNKILRAKANLTFDTLDKIADALNVEITSPKIKTQRSLHSPVIRDVMKVAYKKPNVIEEDRSSEVSTSTNAILEGTIEAMNEYRYTADQI